MKVTPAQKSRSTGPDAGHEGPSANESHYLQAGAAGLERVERRHVHVNEWRCRYRLQLTRSNRCGNHN